MDKKILTREVNLKDHLNSIEDNMIADNGLDTRIPIKGSVRIYNNITGELLRAKDNLVVYASREIIIPRIFNKDRTSGEIKRNYSINWISVGTGGASVADPYTPLMVKSTDESLVNEIVLSSGNPDYVDGGKKKPILWDEKEILADELNDNRYLICKTTTLIGRDEANGVSGNHINEAALWWSPSPYTTDGNTGFNPANAGDPNNFVMASRFTFPTLYKTDAMEFLIVWFYFV